jgi:hypothetical protein
MSTFRIDSLVLAVKDVMHNPSEGSACIPDDQDVLEIFVWDCWWALFEREPFPCWCGLIQNRDAAIVHHSRHKNN